ncbi:MAG: hypothetical protein ACTHJJ_13205 [Intrasporangium sp.]|uniref:hypothetical protein n=1 Tax=Intrasporangium sp. TaxID=1925024 RepID=UPI003F7EEB69
MSDEIRDLLELAPAPRMAIDPYAAVLGGRRRVRRRRAGFTSLGIAAAAAVTAVALQLGGVPHALAPAGSTPPTPIVPTSGPITEPFPSGSAIVGGEIRHADGTGVRIALQPREDGQVVVWAGLLEHGEVYDLTKGVRPPVPPGDASWSYGGTHGPRSLRGVFGGAVSSAAVAVASVRDSDQAAITVQPMSDGKHTVFDAVLPTDAAFHRVVGLAWTVNGRSVAKPVLSPGTGVSLVTTAAGDELVLWRTDRGMGATSGSGSVGFATGSGQLEVVGTRAGRPLTGDGAFGWVAGPPIKVSSTDDTDRWTVSYGGPVDGRTPFVVVPVGGTFRGSLTISNESASVTLAP